MKVLPIFLVPLLAVSLVDGFGADDPRAQIAADNSNLAVRSDFRNLRIAAQGGDKKVHVAFLGGSITQNAGGHTAMVPVWLDERFPGAEFEFTNAGLGSTCSTSGAFRIGDHILGKGNLDLLVVEFAVNDDQDAGHARRECLRGMEGVVRRVRRERPACEILMIHYVNPGMLEKLRGGETPVSIEAHEAVANHYGVTSVNVAAEVADAVDGGRYEWKDYGGTHPGKFGYRVASNMVIAAIEAGLAKGGKGSDEPTQYAMPEAMDVSSYDGGTFVHPGKVQASKGWKIGKVSRELLPVGAIREQYEEYDVLRGEAAGETLSLDFVGRAVGAFVLAGPDAGILESRLDGGEWVGHDLYHKHSGKLNYPRSVVFYSDPGSGARAHKLDLRIGKGKNPKSSGHAASILFFEINDVSEKGEWVSLFEGETTSGWTPRVEVVTFEAVDGELHLLSEKNVWVTSDLSLKDFIFEAEVKLPEDAAESGFNSGFAFRCSGEKGKPVGYQCEVEGVLPGETGGIYGIGMGGWIYPVEETAAEHLGRIEKAGLKAAGWNAYRVRCEGPRIRTWVNEVLISDIEDKRSLEGFFGIQHHGKGGVVKFRNLRVMDLSGR